MKKCTINELILFKYFSTNQNKIEYSIDDKDLYYIKNKDGYRIGDEDLDEPQYFSRPNTN